MRPRSLVIGMWKTSSIKPTIASGGALPPSLFDAWTSPPQRRLSSSEVPLRFVDLVWSWGPGAQRTSERGADVRARNERDAAALSLWQLFGLFPSVFCGRLVCGGTVVQGKGRITLPLALLHALTLARVISCPLSPFLKALPVLSLLNLRDKCTSEPDRWILFGREEQRWKNGSGAIACRLS